MEWNLFQNMSGTIRQNEHALREQDRLLEIVGDEEQRALDVVQKIREPVLKSAPRDRVERTERLVQEEDRRLGHQCTE